MSRPAERKEETSKLLESNIQDKSYLICISGKERKTRRKTQKAKMPILTRRIVGGKQPPLHPIWM
jgi:hypothetical protein